MADNQKVTEQQILSALSVIIDPDLGKDIVSLGFVKDIKICGGQVGFNIELTTPACPVKDRFKKQAEEAVLAIDGVESVNVSMTSQVRGREQLAPEEYLPKVKNVIAVASGKGGVGKSTVSVNLAVALAKTGAKVGLLDADIYGPSIPLMMGTSGRPQLNSENKIMPMERFGVQIMSLGFLLPDDQAVVWRGPLVAGAVKQLLSDVEWGELDYLVVDLPPGTGDAPLTLAQTAPLTGIVIVMTPQDVALSIASKSVVMFRKLEEGLKRSMPILGIVENMSGFICPDCGSYHEVFVGAGGAAAAERLGVPYLGAIPLDPNICASGDAGTPAIITDPESKQAASFEAIAGKLAQQLSITQMQKS